MPVQKRRSASCPRRKVSWPICCATMMAVAVLWAAAALSKAQFCQNPQETGPPLKKHAICVNKILAIRARTKKTAPEGAAELGAFGPSLCEGGAQRGDKGPRQGGEKAQASEKLGQYLAHNIRRSRWPQIRGTRSPPAPTDQGHRSGLHGVERRQLQSCGWRLSSFDPLMFSSVNQMFSF